MTTKTRCCMCGIDVLTTNLNKIIQCSTCGYDIIVVKCLKNCDGVVCIADLYENGTETKTETKTKPKCNKCDVLYTFTRCKTCNIIMYHYEIKGSICSSCNENGLNNQPAVFASMTFRKIGKFRTLCYNSKPLILLENYEDDSIKDMMPLAIMTYIDKQTNCINERIDNLTKKLDRLLELIEFSPDGGPEFQAAQQRWNDNVSNMNDMENMK